MDNKKKNFWFNVTNSLMAFLSYIILFGFLIAVFVSLTGCAANSKSNTDSSSVSQVESSVKPLVIDTEKEYEEMINIKAINMYGDETFKYEGIATVNQKGDITYVYIDMQNEGK